MSYEPPEVVDYGDLVDLTAATSLFADEDGGSKILPQHHTAPSSP